MRELQASSQVFLGLERSGRWKRELEAAVARRPGGGSPRSPPSPQSPRAAAASTQREEAPARYDPAAMDAAVVRIQKHARGTITRKQGRHNKRSEPELPRADAGTQTPPDSPAHRAADPYADLYAARRLSSEDAPAAD